MQTVVLMMLIQWESPELGDDVEVTEGGGGGQHKASNHDQSDHGGNSFQVKWKRFNYPQRCHTHTHTRLCTCTDPVFLNQRDRQTVRETQCSCSSLEVLQSNCPARVKGAVHSKETRIAGAELPSQGFQMPFTKAFISSKKKKMLLKSVECVSIGTILQNSWEAWFNVDRADLLYITPNVCGGKWTFSNFQMSLNPPLYRWKLSPNANEANEAPEAGRQGAAVATGAGRRVTLNWKKVTRIRKSVKLSVHLALNKYWQKLQALAKKRKKKKKDLRSSKTRCRRCLSNPGC